MSKKITIELSDQEYEALAKFFEQAKNSKLMPTQALNIDDFCKEMITTFVKGPDLSSLKDLNMEDLLGGMGDLSQLKDILSGLAPDKKPDEKKEEKKEEFIPDEQKYKS